jgi:hypothetical protein
LLTGVAPAEPEFVPELELSLPPHAARPMATNAIAATVSSGARLSFIFGPLFRIGPNVTSSTAPLPAGIV